MNIFATLCINYLQLLNVVVYYNTHIGEKKVNIKKLLAIASVVSLSTVALFANGTKEINSNPNSYKVGVSKILPHPALDAVEQGIQDYLATTDLEIAYDFQNANGDISTAASIASQLKSEKVDVAVGIGTPTAQALANSMKTTPIVFSAVTDPEASGLTGPTYCGVSDVTPVEAQLKLLVEVTGAKVIGNIYTSGEANGVIINNMVQEACDNLGLECVSSAVSNSAEVKMAAQSIIDRVDAIYLGPDNAVVSAFSSISDVSSKNNIPVMSADPTSSNGFDYLISWGFNYYNIGVATGKVIEQCLNGANPGDIGTVVLQDPSDFELWLNLDYAKQLGIEFDQDLIDQAAVLVIDGENVEQ
jgi:putative ABC transport system substrate-binding protein